jgi:hypothetical protein
MGGNSLALKSIFRVYRRAFRATEKNIYFICKYQHLT